jgi:hypothetical protein
MELFVGGSHLPPDAKMWRAFWDILRFEKIPAQYPDVNRKIASVQITEEMRIFRGL